MTQRPETKDQGHPVHTLAADQRRDQTPETGGKIEIQGDGERRMKREELIHGKEGGTLLYQGSLERLKYAW